MKKYAFFEKNTSHNYYDMLLYVLHHFDFKEE
jgi:hypothetical protein